MAPAIVAIECLRDDEIGWSPSRRSTIIRAIQRRMGGVDVARTAKSASAGRSAVGRGTRRVSAVASLVAAMLWAMTAPQTIASASDPISVLATPPGLVSVQLTLHACPTSYGISGVTPATLPRRVHALVPPDMRTGLSEFSDGLGLLRLVAPSTWTCRAVVDADGSSSLTIAPAKTVASLGPLGARSQVQEIAGFQDGGCVGCAITQACPLFATARALAQGLPCPTKIRGESTASIAGNVVEFVDPPGVHGDATPSGGAYPSYGVMLFRAGRHVSSRLATCVASPVDRELCAVILHNFSHLTGAG